VVYYVYDRFEDLAVFAAIKRCIRPVIGGLLLTIALQMLSLNVGVATSYDLSVPAVIAASAALLALLVWMGHVRELPLGALIAVAMGWGLVSCAAIAAL
jgi:chromate transporter